MTTVSKIKRSPLALAVTGALLSWQLNALAQEPTPEIEIEQPQPIEEVVAVGRTISATQELINERLTDANVVDTLGAETMARLGDSTVGAVLRRLPGLTLVNDQFVYIRGLGERYSASLLNSAVIPSPDLTRNVIPLDIFPTSIVESLRVQKAWAPNLPANFGGGNVDIRTRSIPDGFLFQAELGTGYNDINADDGLTYPGGGDDRLGTDDGTRALPQSFLNAVERFQGQIGVQDILVTLQRQDPSATLADAQQVNRELATQLNRSSVVQTKDVPLDYNVKVSIGNSWLIGNDWEFGALVGGNYQQEWRTQTAFRRDAAFPVERIDTEQETTRAINVSGTGAFGLRFTDDHEIETTTLWLRNTDDETAVNDFFNENRQVSDEQGFRNYRFQFEERLLLTNQIRGTHYLGQETRERFGIVDTLAGWLPLETKIEWWYSDSTAETDIPNQVDVTLGTVTELGTGRTLDEEVGLNNRAALHRFTDLEDEVEDYGWSFTVPVEFGRNYVEFSGGTRHDQKVRTYRQLEFSIGPLEVDDPATLSQPIDEVFSDANILNPDNNFVLDRQGTNQESYIAATMTDAAFGYVDWTYDDTWRVAAGGRYEDYRQASIEWNPLGFTLEDPQINLCNIVDPCDFFSPDFDDSDFTPQVGFQDDKFYPAMAVTYMGEFWAETFQLRFGWSETTVRPDLRELTNASYIDPITDDLTRGDPSVTPADVTNLDVRAEWFFGNGDNFTTTFFYKDLQNPIEFFESAVSDTKTAREIINADSAEIAGVEVEFLKELSFLGDFFDPFFLQANATFQDTELAAGPRADAPTNPVRELAGASDWMMNVVLGFDSNDAKHSATLVFNTFGERLYSAGRNQAPDSFEQPFDSLDLTYSWYPTDEVTVRFKAQNMLDDSITIDRGGVTIFDEKPGVTFSLSVQYFLF